MIKNIEDVRAQYDTGSALLIKRAASGKYSLFLPLTNIPATGSNPDQVEVTVTTARTKTYIEGRKDNPQKELTFYAHRDNFMKIKDEQALGIRDFLQINPDGTAWAYKGKIAYYQDETSVNNTITAKATITVISAEEDVRNMVDDLVEDIVTFTSTVPGEVSLAAAGTKEITVETDPSTATIAVASDATSVATVAVAANKVTITGVAAGYAIVKITGTVTGSASNYTTVKVKVS